jgi:Holliday junction DNA helicase RuvA
MIVQISGVLIKKNIKEVVIESNGLGYLCFVSNNTFNQLPNLGDSLTLLTFLHITESKHTLYGFQSEQERNLFKLLISVSGIGPKIGIQLLSSTSTSQFQTMIINDDVKMLSSLPGIGPKTAKRLIIELKEKFTLVDKNEIPTDDLSKQHYDAYHALISLGYHPKSIESSINKIVSSNSKIDTENLIKEALKELR